MLAITDAWELAAGDGVDFYWQTRLPVAVDGHAITITGRHARVIIEAPSDTTVRVDELSLLDGVQHRIAIHNPAMAGEMTVRIRLTR
ncbi:MAG: hypothetical protein BWY76_00297 [bacterium ADurb.Bin429]|nr:MAG: hypothetical protein BWY76_00297 [bacterium ADurb.Bin429]